MKKKIAFLGGGPEQVIAIRIARELGYQTLVVDDNTLAPGRTEADEFISTRIKDVEGLISALKPFNISGICTHASELSVETAAVACALGLPGISTASAELATYKEKRIKCFAERGIFVPQNKILEYSAIFEEWTLAGKEIGYPLVVKPSNQKGAVGVLRIQNENELFVYYSTVRQDIYSKVYVFEQFIDGNQYSTETVLVNGHCLRHNFAYRHYAGMERFYPYLIEDGHSMPVSFSSGEKESLIEAIEKSAKALGITDGIIKGDLLIDKNGNVYVIEMASRSSGGRFADFVTPHQCGVQILYALIQIAAGDTVAVETLQEKWNIGISQRFLFLPEGKTVTTIKNADIIRSMPNVLDVVFSADFIKNRTQKKIVSHASRIGYVICRGATQQEADANALTTCELLINNME